MIPSGTCNGEFVCRDLFYRDDFARALYKAHIKALLTRVNVFTGRAYRDGAPGRAMPYHDAYVMTP